MCCKEGQQGGDGEAMEGIAEAINNLARAVNNLGIGLFIALLMFLFFKSMGGKK